MRKNETFLKSILSLLKYHSKKNKKFKYLIKNLSNGLNNIKNLNQLPFIHVNCFKENDLLSVRKEKIVTTLFSSGTTSSGRSKIFLDKKNVLYQKKILSRLLFKNISNVRLPMIILDKKINKIEKDDFNAKIAAIYGFSLIGKNYFYILNNDGSINYSGLKKFLKMNSNSKILMFGFTFDVYNILMKKLKKNLNFKFHNAILVHGGGWKKMEKIKISNYSFKKEIYNKFGIKNIINYYGVVEQTGSIFFECKKCNNFKTNEYSDIIIRRSDLNVCDNNEKGIVQLLSLVPTSYPGNSILFEDLGRITNNKCRDCQNFKSFNIEGRIKNVEIRGCSDAI